MAEPLVFTGTGTTVRFDAGEDQATNQYVALVKLDNVWAGDVYASDFNFA
jgi:hypothetical protein